MIIHYTADTSFDGAVSWFKNASAKASAHLVIDRDGKIVQMAPFNKVTWHAGKSSWGELDGMNNYAIGIELVNAGRLSKTEDGIWKNWVPRVVPPSEVVVATHKNEHAASGWQTYPERQLEVAIAVGLALQSKYGFKDVLGHDDVSPGRKSDPGPAFPMISYKSKLLGRA